MGRFASKAKYEILEVQGEKLKLVFDINAMALVEERYESLNSALTLLKTKPFTTIKGLLEIGLYNEELDSEDIAAIVQDLGIEKLSTLIGKNINDNLVKKKKAKQRKK